MEKFLKIIKINILSVIALPLLLLATACKLISKALEKLGIILGMLIMILLLVAGFEFIKNPDGGLNVIIHIIVMCIVAGLIVALLIWLANLAAAIVIAIWSGIIGFFEAIYDFTYTGFLHLFAICENDYLYISLNGRKILNAFLCLFFTILRAANKLIVTVISLALGASVILSILIVGGSLIGLSHNFNHTFGLNIFEAAARYDTFSLVYGIVMYIAVTALFVTVLLSLGIEWNEWAAELKLTGEELTENIAEIQQSDWRIAADPSVTNETADAYLQNLREHIESLEPLGDQVEELLTSTDNSLLRSTWGNYYRNLSDIVDECQKHRSGIPHDQFKRLVPRIQQLEKQRDDVRRIVEKLRVLQDDPVKASVFFAGCNTADKLEKRYKSLCKAYHPDAEGGDKETFQKMQDEYARLKEYLQLSDD